jgi:hypothetical protein
MLLTVAEVSASQIKILKEEYHEIQYEGQGGRHVSQNKG